LGEPDQGSRLDPRHCPRGEFLCDAQVHDRSVALRNVEVGYLVDEGDYVYPFDNPDSLEIQRVWEPPRNVIRRPPPVPNVCVQKHAQRLPIGVGKAFVALLVHRPQNERLGFGFRAATWAWSHVLASMYDGPRIWLTDGYGPSPRVARGVHEHEEG